MNGAVTNNIIKEYIMTNEVLANDIAAQLEVPVTNPVEPTEVVEETPEQVTVREEKALHASIAEQMNGRRGYAIVTSNVTLDTPAFAYTIGLTAKGRPEIFLSGNMNPKTAIGIIESLVNRWEKDKRVTIGKMSKFITMGTKQWPIKVVRIDPVEAEELHTKLIRKYYPIFNFKLVQVYWPDSNGYLPDYEKYTTEEGHKQHMFPTI